MRLLRNSTFIDPEEYLKRNPDVAMRGMDPILHYLRHGWREGRNPSPRFDARKYLELHPEVAEASVSPLVHFLRYGRVSGATATPERRDTWVGRPTSAGSGPGRAVVERGSNTGRATIRVRTEPLRLSPPVVSLRGGRLSMRCEIADAPALHATLDGPAADLARIEPRIEPFIPVALLMAGAARRDLVVEGPVDEDFLTTLRLRLIPLLHSLYEFPLTTLLAETPKQRGASNKTARAAEPDPGALLFSGGIDSFYSLVRLREVGHPLRLLVNVNAGGSDDMRACVGRRRRRIAEVADEAGLDLLTVDTNFHEVVEIGHIYVHPFRTVPAAYTTHGAIDGLFLSPAFAYYEFSSDWLRMGLDTPLATSLAWARMPVTEIGHDRSRHEKLLALTDEPLTYRALDVCVDDAYCATAGPDEPVNCGACFKCARTLLALEHMGRLDRYVSQFNVERFKADREKALRMVREHDSDIDRDLLARVGGIDPAPPPTLRVDPPAWAEQSTRSGDENPDRDVVVRRHTQPQPIRLFWSADRRKYVPNLGDELSPMIVELVSRRRVKWASPEECELAAIGSIMEMLLRADRAEPIIVWGSGFMGDGPTLRHTAVRAAALRGPYSAARLGIEGDLPLGDPGLLAGELLSHRPSKKRAIGIVPHFVDLDLPIIEAWNTDPGAVISPRMPVIDFLEAVASCDLILSSSLHGLVVADALGVPNHWVQLSGSVWGNGFKFRDHLRFAGRQEAPGVPMMPEQMEQAVIDDLVNGYRPIDISAVREQLTRAFPIG